MASAKTPPRAKNAKTERNGDSAAASRASSMSTNARFGVAAMLIATQITAAYANAQAQANAQEAPSFAAEMAAAGGSTSMATSMTTSRQANRAMEGTQGSEDDIEEVTVNSIANTTRSQELEAVDKQKQDCLDALFFADRNGDRKMVESDYVTFVQILGPDDFARGIEFFSELPSGLRNNFELLSCLCLSYDGLGCCGSGVRFISNLGAFPGEVRTRDQDNYLDTVCELSQASVNLAANSPAPTMHPSTSPTSAPTGAPTSAPTAQPTLVPTSAPSSMASDAPTAPPTSAPTATRTGSPTDTPTSVPTSLPTSSPTAAASDLPTVLESAAPTSAPSSVPSHRPSSLGSAPPTTTSSPTATPTGSPSETPSSQPTGSPSASPSVAPSSTPTSSPTITASVSPTESSMPTATPSEPPSSNPTLTAQPTNQPSESPSAQPTTTPGPTQVPTELPPDAIASVKFLISLENGTTQTYTRNQYIPDIEASLDQYAADLTNALNEGSSRRRLQVTVEQSSVSGVVRQDCPESISENDSCEEVSASIGISVTDEDAAATQTTMEKGATEAVNSGDMQTILLGINPNTPIRILDESAFSGGTNRSTGTGNSSEPIGAGPIVGFVAAGLLLVGLVSFFLVRRGTQDVSSESYEDKRSYELAEEDHLALETSEGPIHMMDTGTSDEEQGISTPEPSSPDRTYMTPGSTGNVSRISAAAIATGAAGRYNDHESASAGSSGWSSRDGLSSVDESSHTSDDVENMLRDADSKRGGTTQARMLAASSLPTEYANRSMSSASRSGDEEDGDEIATAFSELDQAMHRGDWAAVGVTAALLASRSTESMSSGGGYSTDSPVKSKVIDANRAAELDRLVAAGDWEAVVSAAARFDAEENRTNLLSSHAANASQSSVSVGSGSGVESTGSGTVPSTSFAGTSIAGSTLNTNDSRGTTDSKAKRRSEYRAEITTLVKRVVPEEVDNIDEMMVQFKGREEELLETLRTMHEREVAKRARLAGHKQAKRAARSAIEDKTDPVNPSSSSGTVASMASSINSSSVAFVPADGQDERRAGDRSATNDSTISSRYAAPIDAGDWDTGAAGVARIENDAGFSSEDNSNSTGSSTTEPDAGNDGGWAGAVKKPEADKEETVDEKRARRLKRLQEEEEAFAQADIWSAIAEQTKTDTEDSENAGASNAATWAIDRSLSALVQAEGTGQLRDSFSRSRPPSEKRGSNHEDEV